MAEMSREEIEAQGYEIVREWDVAGTAGTQRYASVLLAGAHVGQERVIIIKSPQPAELGQVVSGYVSPAEERKPPAELRPLRQREQEAFERAGLRDVQEVEFGFRGAVAPPEEELAEETRVIERPKPIEVVPPPSPWKIIPFAFKAPFVAAERAVKKYIPLKKVTEKLPPVEKVITPKVEAYFKKVYKPITKAEIIVHPFQAFIRPPPEKLAERAIGITRGVYRTVREEPWTVVGYAAVGAAVPPAFAGLKYLKVPVPLVKAVGVGLGATWLGGKAFEIAKAPTERERGEIIGRGLVEVGALAIGAKYIGAPAAARIESKAIVREQIKKLSPAQQAKFKKFFKEAKAAEASGHPPVKEVSLKGTERIPSRARGTIKSFLRQKKDLLGGSMAQRTQLHGKAAVGRSYKTSDVDVYTKGSPVKRASSLVKALKARGIKRVSQVPGTGRITIEGEKAVEFHTMERYAQNIYQAEGFFRPVKETITTDPTGIRVQTIGSQAKRKLIGAYLQGRYEKDYPDFKRAITSIRQATEAEARRALFKEPRAKEVLREKRLERLLPKREAPKPERPPPKAKLKPKPREELVPVLLPKPKKPIPRFARIIERLPKPRKLVKRPPKIEPYPYKVPKVKAAMYLLPIKKKAPYAVEEVKVPSIYVPSVRKVPSAPYIAPTPPYKPPVIPTPPTPPPPYKPPKVPPKALPYAPPKVPPYAPPIAAPYAPPSVPYVPPLRVPTRRAAYRPKFGIKPPRVKLLPSVPRKLMYKPSLVGIALGKTIAKAPKKMLTGLEIRAPVKRKRKKRRWLGGLKL